MRRYETIFILRPNLGEEEINRVIDYTTEIIKNDGGTVIDLNRWGMKKLAYLIKKESLGYYVFCDYAGEPATVSEMERRFRIDDAVMKYMTIKTAAEINDEGLQQAVSEVTERVASEEAAKADADAEETGEAEQKEVQETESTTSEASAA